MCNDCVQIKSPDQIIKGCCDVKSGYYCIWDITHMTLVCEEWAELCDLYNVLRQISHITFNVVSERQRARNALNNLKREAPFNECKRFPWRKTYVNISCSVYGTLFQNILGALDYKDRETEKELRYGKDREQKDPDQTASSSSSIDDSKTAYRNNIKAVLNELCKRNEVFDRIRFETKYDLRWCEGPCPTEPGAPSTNPPGNDPNNPNLPNRKTYGNMMQLLRTKGLDPEDFNVFNETDMQREKIICGRENTQRLGPTLNNNLLPSGVKKVYIFSNGEYVKCGSLTPMRGYIYDVEANTLSNEVELKPDNTFDFELISKIVDDILSEKDSKDEIESVSSESSKKSDYRHKEDNRNNFPYRSRYNHYERRKRDDYYYRHPNWRNDYRSYDNFNSRRRFYEDKVKESNLKYDSKPSNDKGKDKEKDVGSNSSVEIIE